MGKYDWEEDPPEEEKTTHELPEIPRFESIKTIEKKVDETIENRKEKTFAETPEEQDEIKTMEMIKAEPIIPGNVQVEIGAGKYVIDLHDLYAGQINDGPGTIIPNLIEDAERAALERRDSYKPEKRSLDFKYWWVIFLMIGIIAMAYVAMMMFG